MRNFRLLIVGVFGAVIALGMTGCATIEGQGGYLNFVQCDCVTAWNPQTGGKSNTINDADFQSCVFYRNCVNNYPGELVGTVKQSLEIVGQQQSLDGVLASKDGRNARYLVSQANIDFTSDQYKEYANMLFLSPLDDSKYADKFWNSATRDKWDLNWLTDYSLKNEVTGHCQEFESLVMDRMDKNQLQNWALAYYAKWNARTSECHGMLLEKINPIIVSEVMEQASIALKNKRYQDVINQISGFDGYKNDSELMLDLGLAYFDLGQISQSVDTLSAAKALDPSNSNIQGWLDAAKEKEQKDDLMTALKMKQQAALQSIQPQMDNVSTTALAEKKNQDIGLNGYKGVMWGSAVDDTLATFNADPSSLTNSNQGIIGEFDVDSALYEVMKIPYINIMDGVYGYDVPSDVISRFSNLSLNNGDHVIFFDNKFACYLFEVDAVNYSKYKNTLMEKYGDAEIFSRSPQQMGNDGTTTNLTILSWKKEKTKIILIKNHSETSSLGMASTSVYIAYFSSAIFNDVKNARLESEQDEKSKEEGQQEDSTNEDLNKIQ